MPIFGHRAEPSVSTPPPEVPEKDLSPRRRSTLFGRGNRSASPSRESVNTYSTSRTHHSGSTSPPRRGLLHRHDEDPSIVAARERVISAEAAEKEADRALLGARAAVKEAREQIKRLEKEAAEEARLAKIKQNQAKSISKRGHTLGRHGV